MTTGKKRALATIIAAFVPFLFLAWVDLDLLAAAATPETRFWSAFFGIGTAFMAWTYPGWED